MVEGSAHGDVAKIAEGPYFDELTIGTVFGTAPGVTLTSGLVDAHRAIVGNRLALTLDHALCAQVTGGGPLAPPAVVWDIAIGQSTVATQHVKANLFYRGLVFRRAPEIADTLRTSTEVVALRQNSRRSTGLAALRITTVDQLGRPVLDFLRCAMLPLRDPDLDTGHADDLDALDVPARLADFTDGWLLPARSAELAVGQSWRIGGGDVVTSAPELARLTLNVAKVHHEGAARLVYGGHTIGIALAQASRALPSMLTVLGWQSCDHLAPVREGDVLHSTLSVEDVNGTHVGLRSRVNAGDTPVLDWRFTALIA